MCSTPWFDQTSFLDPLQNIFIDILHALVDDTVNKLCSKLPYRGTLQLLSANSFTKIDDVSILQIVF